MNNNKKKHLLVIDPTAFAGGSKIATENILHLLDNDRVRITVATVDQRSWRSSNLTRVPLWQPSWLAHREQGLPYFLRHLTIAGHLLWLRWRTGRFDLALGASGPGVDLALYLVKPLLGFEIVQLIHGPIAKSRTIGRALLKAGQVHFLESTRPSILTALATVSSPCHDLPSRYHVMSNGLSKQAWPTRCQGEHPVIFWAASLLKWKGLDLLLAALKLMDSDNRPEAHICYIRPEQTTLPISTAPIPMDQVVWHEAPQDLDRLRANANIFISTSTNEPFGLSILEALAAGHCVLIPKDNAYWDQVLSDGINCIKYNPNDADDLAEKLLSLKGDMARVKNMGAAAIAVADDYRAENQYAHLKKVLERGDSEQTTTKECHKQPEIIP